MKKDRVAKVKKWQLLRFQSKKPIANLSALEALSVGRRAFARKKSLQEVILPAELSAIKTKAFLHCKQLTTVTLGNQNAVGISEKAFFKCSSLRHVENSGMIFSIGANAFAGCTALESIALGGDLRRIGEYAFAGCQALTALTLPSGVDRIEKNAFCNCTSLARLTICEGVTSLAPNLFYHCRALTSVEIPQTLSSIATGAFRNCSALQELRLPSGIKRIEKRAFLGCSKLSTVAIELGCERIGARAFADCHTLTTVTIPRTVKRLGFAAFGLGKKQDKIIMYVENEYMLRRMKRLLFFCGSLGRVEPILAGKTVEQRKRERRRTTLEKEPVHLIDPSISFEKHPITHTTESKEPQETIDVPTDACNKALPDTSISIQEQSRDQTASDTENE